MEGVSLSIKFCKKNSFDLNCYFQAPLAKVPSSVRKCNVHVITERWTLRVSLRLPAVSNLKRYSKDLEYEYRVKTATLGTLKRYSILSLTLYLEW
jgi:hypothetical protein